MKESYAVFTKEVSRLEDTIGKSCKFVPNKLEWFNKVQKAHFKIREQLNGLKIQLDVETTGLPPRPKKLEQLARKVFFLDTQLMNKHDIEPRDIMFPYLQSKQKTGKFILQLLKKDKEKYREATKIFSDMGEYWSELEGTKDQYNITLDTSAMSFVKLGHYGCDKGSCFANDNKKEIHKYALGMRKNSFVFLVSNNDSILARTWGIWDDNQSVISFCNVYREKEIAFASISECMQAMAKKFLTCDKIDLYENYVSVDKELIHLNQGRSDFSFIQGGFIPKKIVF
jgi:hypothetical protein